MNYVVAMTREASADDDRTWQMVIYEGNPASDGYEAGSVWTDEDGSVWKIVDIFPDNQG